MKPKETIERFDRFLADEGLHLDAVVIGGVAMALLGVTSRQTRDCDVLTPQIPTAIVDAACRFAARERERGEPLDDSWLNNGPASLADALPAGWLGRVQTVFAGRALTLHTLGRIDLLMSKVFALCDRGLDLPDCVALAPTAEELEEVSTWLVRQDLHPDWPDHVRETISDLRRRLGHAV
jgi:hypothetical protein